MTERAFRADLSSVPTTVLVLPDSSGVPPRQLNPNEKRLLSAAQTQLKQRQLDMAAQREFERQLTATTQARLFDRFTPPKAASVTAGLQSSSVPTASESTLSLAVLSAVREGRKAASLELEQKPALRNQGNVQLSQQQPPNPEVEVQPWTETALEAAEVIISATIRPRARERAHQVLRAIYQATYTLICHRQQLLTASSYTFFTVLDVLPAVTGLSAATCERATKDLRGAGLIATWSSWTDARFFDPATKQYVTRRTKQGVWLTACLKPRLGHRAITLTDELPDEAPRDLAADRKAGNTAWQLRKEAEEVRASVSYEKESVDIYSLLRWSLPKSFKTNCVKESDALTWPGELFNRAEQPQDVVWNLSVITSVHPQHRREVIEAAGVALARIFRDRHSEKQYFRLLWRASDAQYSGQPAFEQLQLLMGQVLSDMAELDVRRPGAWLRRKLRDFGWLDQVDDSGLAAVRFRA